MLTFCNSYVSWLLRCVQLCLVTVMFTLRDVTFCSSTIIISWIDFHHKVSMYCKIQLIAIKIIHCHDCDGVSPPPPFQCLNPGALASWESLSRIVRKKRRKQARKEHKLDGASDTREYWRIYRGPGFLAVALFWLLPTLSPPSLPSVRSTGDTQEDLERETTCWRGRKGKGVGEELNHSTTRRPGSL